MLQEEIKLKAHLVTGDQQIPIDAKYGSKHSLLVRFLNGNGFHNESQFSKLIIHMNGEDVELGPSRLIKEPNIDGHAGRLIFVNDVYDLESLVRNKKIVKLQNSFVNLPLVLAHKNRIRQSFKNYTANLTYDLSVYKNLFDRLDAEYRDEPEHIQRIVQMAIIDTEGKKLMRYLEKLDSDDIVNRVPADFDDVGP